MSSAIPPLPAYTKFVEPQMGTFTIDAPVGWQIRAGFFHPIPGDRRTWIQSISPEGIFLFAGDAEFPQSFCHFMGQFEGAPTQMAAGGTFISLTPSADRLADHYLKVWGARRFGQFKVLGRRPRPDVCAVIRQTVAQMGITLSRKFQISAAEVLLQVTIQGVTRAASLLATAGFSGEYAMNTFAFWEGNIQAYIAPPALADQADRTRLHMLGSYRHTPKLMQIYQQDEAIIAANGRLANDAQRNWFAGQQSAHAAQMAIGDNLVNNYWNQQAANDRMAHSRDQQQVIDDDRSQNRSDAMMDRQRLADDGMGRTYKVPAGHDYYWLDAQSGRVIGTDTATPPDYQNTYTPLRKL